MVAVVHPRQQPSPPGSTRTPAWTIIDHICCRQEDRMRVTSIVANLSVADIEAAQNFYTDYLGLSTEEGTVA